MTITVNQRSFLKRGTLAEISAPDLFGAQAWRVACVDVGPNSTLLLQGGILLAPIFIASQAPDAIAPWWSINVLQYHSLKPSLGTGRVRIWRFRSFEGLYNKNILEQELIVNPTGDLNGRIGDFRITSLSFRVEYDASRFSSRVANTVGKGFFSLKEDKLIKLKHFQNENKELAKHVFDGNRGEDFIREDYPRVKIGELYETISKAHTLETEISQMFLNG